MHRAGTSAGRSAPGVAYCALDRGRKALNGQEIRPCWEPVIALMGAAATANEAVDLPASDLISVETLAGAELDSGRFWRDAER